MVAHESSLAQLQASQESAFVALVDEYYAVTYHYLYRLTNQRVFTMPCALSLRGAVAIGCRC